MTTYILHGGYTRKKSVHNKNFFKKMFLAAKDGKILVVYFAKVKKRWPEMLAEDKKKFQRIAGKKKFELVLASDNLKVFRKQVSKIKSVYIRGGSDQRLQKKLRKIKSGLPKLFSAKTIAGSSAGADLISKYFYSIDTKRIETGIGILPIKVYIHYKNDRKNLEKLKKHEENLKTYAIAEAKFIALTIPNI